VGVNRVVIRILVLAIASIAIPAGKAADLSFAPAYQNGKAVFEIDQVIGGDIDDEEYYLYRPSDLALDSQGNLFVLDHKGHCVKKFDPEGNHLTTFGREGEGPGEMDRAFRIAIDSEDNVVIYDTSLRRFSFFDNSGELLDSIHLSEIGHRSIFDFQVHPNGDIYVRFSESDLRRPESPARASVSRLRFDPYEEATVDSASIKTIHVIRQEAGYTAFGAPFPQQLLWGITPTGNIVTAHSEDYTVRFYSPDLTLVSERTISKQRPKVTDQDKEDYFDFFKDDSQAALLRKSVKFPKYKPHFTSLLIDDEGFILLRVKEEDDQDTYDILKPDGSYFAEVVLPHLGRSAILSRGYIYNIQLHEERDYAVYRYVLVQCICRAFGVMSLACGRIESRIEL
jgi:hypothetical protein